MIAKADEIIISDNSHIFEAICDNDHASGKVILVQSDWQNFLHNSRNIDLLIICKKLDPRLIPVHKIRAIINLSENNIARHEIRLSKPLKLFQLIEIIGKLRQERDSLFCPLDDNWVYNEKYSCIASSNEVIKLTEKENAVFRALIVSNDHKIDKEHLRVKVWNYHKNSESTTVDTHLYKLRQKLPAGMMNIKDNICSLSL
jgi:hypothetical protein